MIEIFIFLAIAITNSFAGEPSNPTPVTIPQSVSDEIKQILNQAEFEKILELFEQTPSNPPNTPSSKSTSTPWKFFQLPCCNYWVSSTNGHIPRIRDDTHYHIGKYSEEKKSEEPLHKMTIPGEEKSRRSMCPVCKTEFLYTRSGWVRHLNSHRPVD